MVVKDKKPRQTKRDPEGVKRDILKVASKEFAANGLSGARIDEISAQTKTSKRMIYYYFGDKEGLYQQCLETAYANIRREEEELDLEGLAPDEALARLVAFTFEHHRQKPDFIRMVMIENIHNATYLGRSEVIRSLNSVVIGQLADIIQRGVAAGLFRPGLDPVELHWQISALSFFNVSNRATFTALFGDAQFSPDRQDKRRDTTVELILRYVRKNEDPAS